MSRWRGAWKYKNHYLSVIPALFFTAFVCFYAGIFTFTVSFRDYTFLKRARPFIGFDNYLGLFKDPSFWNSAGVSLKFAAAAVALALLVGLIFALLLNQNIKFRGIFRSSLLLSWVIPMVAASLIFQWIFDEQAGLANAVLRQLYLGRLNWLGVGRSAFWVIVGCYVWKLFPFSMVLFLGGLQTVPLQLYESASIDGASKSQKFIFITLPLLKPQFAVALIFLTLNSLNMLDVIFVLTGGGPVNATMALSMRMYKEAFELMNLGRASAIAIVLFLINITFAIFYVKALTKKAIY